MPEQYTPTIDEVRSAWQEHFTHPGVGELGQQFDRFIAQVRAEALREAADELSTDKVIIPHHIAVDGGGAVWVVAISHARDAIGRIADTNQHDRSE